MRSKPSGNRGRTSHRQPELIRGTSRILLEHAAQVMGILEPQFIGDFTDGFIGGAEKLLGFVHQLELDMLLGSFSRLFLDEITEIVGGKM